MATTSGELPSDMQKFIGLNYNMFALGAQQALVGNTEAMQQSEDWIWSFISNQHPAPTLAELNELMDRYIQAHTGE